MLLNPERSERFFSFWLGQVKALVGEVQDSAVLDSHGEGRFGLPPAPPGVGLGNPPFTGGELRSQAKSDEKGKEPEPPAEQKHHKEKHHHRDKDQHRKEKKEKRTKEAYKEKEGRRKRKK